MFISVIAGSLVCGLLAIRTIIHRLRTDRGGKEPNVDRNCYQRAMDEIHRLENLVKEKEATIRYLTKNKPL